MSNMSKMSVTEKELYAELEYLMVVHRHKCSVLENNYVFLYNYYV